MEFEFVDDSLEEVYYDPEPTLGLGAAVDKGFRKVVGKIEAAEDERALRALKGLHYHKLGGKRSHQHALNITDKWRLIVERMKEKERIVLRIIGIEDYH